MVAVRSITGLTAERMLEIEAQSVIGGAVLLDRLVLTKHDGSTIDAGNVRGPQGVQGQQGVQGLQGPQGGPGPIVTGLVSPFAGNAAPTGWFLCDGATVSRTTYSALFAVIGTMYGFGDGSTTFHLPNLKGRIPVARDTAQVEFDVVGETGGAKTHTLANAEVPNVQGNIAIHSGEGSNMWQGSGVFSTSPTYDGYKSPTATWGGAPSLSAITFNNGGGGGAHNNLQPYLVMNYIIKT